MNEVNEAMSSLWKKKDDPFDVQDSKEDDVLTAIRKKSDTVPNSQKLLIKYHKDLSQLIPRDEIVQHCELLREYAPTAEVAGSFRREKPFSSDIDVVVREPIAEVVARLKKAKYIVDTFFIGDRKFSGICIHPEFGIHRQIDFIFTTPRSHPFAILYFTGSKKHNVIMRLRARRKGMKLNEYGLFKGDTPVAGIKTEKDIFRALDTPYKRPNER